MELNFDKEIEPARQKALTTLVLKGAPVETAHDIVATSTIKAWRKFDTFRGQCAFSTWFVRIALNTWADLVRHRTRITEVDFDTLEGPLKGLEPLMHRDQYFDGALDDPLYSERCEMRAAMCKLPQHYRKPLEIVLAGGTMDAVQAALKMHSVGAAKSRVHRARTALKRLCKNSTPGDRLDMPLGRPRKAA